jgi:hypothetical protein
LTKLTTRVFLAAAAVQWQLRGKRKKYLKRAWKIAHHLPHWPNGAFKAVALAMMVLLMLSAMRVGKGGTAPEPVL